MDLMKELPMTRTQYEIDMYAVTQSIINTVDRQLQQRPSFDPTTYIESNTRWFRFRRALGWV